MEKENFIPIKQVTNYLCAYLNQSDYGGQVFLGISPNNQVTGLILKREEMDEISPMMNIFKDVIKIGCKTAIKISEKI